MALIFKKGNDPMTIKRIVVLVYGQPGVRKTSWAIKSNKPLLFDFEDGLIRVMGHHRLDSKGEEITFLDMTPIPPQKDAKGNIVEKGEPDGRFVWQRFMEADLELFADYDTLIFDSVSKMMEMAGDYVKTVDAKNVKRNGDLSQQGWGALGQEFIAFKKKYLNNNKNIIFIAHEKEEKEGDRTRKRPDIAGQSRSLITKEADFIGYMQIVNDESVLGFTPQEDYYGKNSCNLPVTFKASEKTVDDIIYDYRQSVNANSKVYAEYKKQISEYQEKIANVEMVLDINVIFDEFREFRAKKLFVLTALNDIWEMIKMKASELGFKAVYQGEKIVSFLDENAVEERAEEKNEEKAEEAKPVETVPTVPSAPKATKKPKTA
jgi:hypothetical protein